MRAVQMTLDDDLLRKVDLAVRRLRTTRSDFARKALRAALDRAATEELERRHRRGYLRHPPRPEEFAGWEAEQVWGDE